MSRIVPGQRYMSTAEPELGLGTVLKQEGRQLQVVYTRAGELRTYALASAPLVRAEFKVGDRIRGRDLEITVERVEERAGLRTYHGEGHSLVESELDDQQASGSADERLMAAILGTNARFELRLEALKRRAESRRSPGYGIHSAKIDLLPHQLRVVDAALRQPMPRVLLADEVGLGKTIEAGLILSRLLASGRVTRALILVPEPLVYQWFIELLRRFNLKPAIFDEERVKAIEEHGEGRNPFQDDQLILTDLQFLTRAPSRAAQVLAAGWDLLVVDEAHHLEWRPEEASPQYQMVESLAMSTPSVVLLTATPEQLGQSGHFARLRLLDPARYSDLEHYTREVARFQDVSRLASRLIDGEPLSDADRAQLLTVLGEERELAAGLGERPTPAQRDRILDALIDRHGTGRVMFRNRRASVGGFPKRRPELTVLPALHDAAAQAALLAEFRQDVGLEAVPPPHTADGRTVAESEHPDVLALLRDPRFDWLCALLERLAPAKVVLICRSARKVGLLEAALRLRSTAKVARFHEGLSLAQRDRNAAHFADPAGARLLLCSEIGSEGRNFQFAHHLVLWDLPLDPDLLEQRIGRLDRIGQREDIRIHHAVVAETPQAALARWIDEGIDALRESPADGRALLKRFGETLVHTALAMAEGRPGSHQKLDALISETRRQHEEQSRRVNEGRDRLLELASQRSVGAEALRAELAAADEEVEADDFMVKLLEHFGLDADDLGPRTFRLDAEYAADDRLSGIREGGETMTFDRRLALSRDDVPLLRLDHPLIQQALDLLIAGDEGSVAALIDPAMPAQLVLLQAVFVLECVAEKRLDLERWLPPQPLSTVVDTRLAVRQWAPSARLVARADETPVNLAPQRRVLQTLVPPMLRAAQTATEERARQLIAEAQTRASAEFGGELTRLRALKRSGGAVRDVEIDALQRHLDAVLATLPQARLRLDALRLVASPAFQKLR
jgi:ATP-dependent helicase HepA